MSKYAEEYKKIYPKLFGSVFIFVMMAFYLVGRSDKPREDFKHLSGTISYFSKAHPLRDHSDSRYKHVYLMLDEHTRISEMFTGTDRGDFSPRINKLNELGTGDGIDIYFEETVKTKMEPVNRLLQYLDKDGEEYYLRSKVDKYIAYFILTCSGLLLILAFYMKAVSG